MSVMNSIDKVLDIYKDGLRTESDSIRDIEKILGAYDTYTKAERRMENLFKERQTINTEISELKALKKEMSVVLAYKGED